MRSLKILLACWFAFWLPTAGASGFDAFAGPRPLAVLIQSDPWLMVNGSDTPRVAVYENGDVIFLKTVNGKRVHRKLSLDEQALAALRERLKPVLLGKPLKANYLQSARTDQSTAMIYLRDGEREVATSVYASICPGDSVGEPQPAPADLQDQAPPRELKALHGWLCGFDAPGSQPWMPPYVEVMLWDYSNAPDASISWPARWPSLTSPRTLKRREAYSIFLDGSQLPALREFLARQKAKGAIEIEHKKMVAAYRFAFPSEPVWRSAFRKADQ